ncbi:uncharacterized protein LOC129726130 [Wyeomyia smithii]|uniref:uncharacterized protein LOC129726130 n=1 Tax=Wyeomyia smithii TaxID=174621 RepID=UPI002467E1F7|nr:uncharacterized protein LOC129726130 [Wyeomyia smithii]
MGHISDFTEEALKKRCNWTIELTEYKRRELCGVVEIYFFLEITAAAGILGAALIVPGLLYLADQDLNDGKLTSVRRTHFFDAATGEELSRAHAEEQHDKNKQAYQLDKEGNELFKQGKYQDSHDKFSQAYNMCSKGYSEEARFKKNRDIAKNKVEKEVEATQNNANRQADQLNREALDLYQQGKYKEAYEKFSKAYAICSKGYCEEETFRTNKNEAKAADLNNDGDRLFHEGKFSEASKKYQQAYDNSYKNRNLYTENIEKAKAEITKRKQADELRVKGKKLWEEAWCAEDEDRCEEATGKFQEANRLLQTAFELVSDSREIRRLSKAASLKVEGNALFNAGIRAQNEGVRLLEAAKELEQQQNYRAAEAKLSEAKGKFTEAIAKFERGCECDSRFAPCVEFTREQLADVLESLEHVQQFLLNDKFTQLNISAASSEAHEKRQPEVSDSFEEFFSQIRW